MRATIIFALLVVTGSAALSGSVLTLTQTLLTKLTLPKYFKASDKIVCDVATDISNWAAANQNMSQLIDSMSAKGNDYKSTIVLTKGAAMSQYFLDFTTCLSKCNDLSFFDWCKGTLGSALYTSLTAPYKICVSDKMPQMIANGKTVAQRAEQCASCGNSQCNDTLIANIVKLTMQRTYVKTWTTCVRPLITAQVLNIANYIPTAGPEKTCLANFPSKAYGQA
ncbi:unnamed protein product, partial [Mesorhabditis spiculigera]